MKGELKQIVLGSQRGVYQAGGAAEAYDRKE